MDQGNYSFSKHARKRAQQRGVQPKTVEMVLKHADVDLEAGNGCRAYRISKRALARMVHDVTELDRATGVVVIVCEATGEIVTVMHDYNGKGRRYRRQWPIWNRTLARHSCAA